MPLEVVESGGAVAGRRNVNWEVAPTLTTSPAALVFTTEAQRPEGFQIIAKRRDGRPFRIESATTEVDGLVVAADTDAEPIHKLTARFRDATLPASRTGTVVIQTDQLDQPMVKVAVYVAGPPANPAPVNPESTR